MSTEDKLNLPAGIEATGGCVWEGCGVPPPELGPCCACGGIKHVDTLVMINRKALTKNASTWGCLVCNVSGGACIVLCAACRKSGEEVKWGCCGRPAKDGRSPIEEFTEVLQHDLAKHPEEVCHRN